MSVLTAIGICGGGARLWEGGGFVDVLVGKLAGAEPCDCVVLERLAGEGGVCGLLLEDAMPACIRRCFLFLGTHRGCGLPAPGLLLLVFLVGFTNGSREGVLVGRPGMPVLIDGGSLRAGRGGGALLLGVALQVQLLGLLVVKSMMG